MPRVVIDRDRCEGHGLCVTEVPEVFELLDSGELRLIDASPPDEYSVALAAAELSCPTRAISVVGE